MSTSHFWKYLPNALGLWSVFNFSAVRAISSLLVYIVWKTDNFNVVKYGDDNMRPPSEIQLQGLFIFRVSLQYTFSEFHSHHLPLIHPAPSSKGWSFPLQTIFTCTQWELFCATNCTRLQKTAFTNNSLMLSCVSWKMARWTKQTHEHRRTHWWFQRLCFKEKFNYK